MYSLYRERDGQGDAGGMSLALWIDDEENVMYEHNARPRVGVMLRVGSIYARTLSWQDWWQTTYIEEILEDTGSMVKFKTENGSVYVWRSGDETQGNDGA